MDNRITFIWGIIVFILVFLINYFIIFKHTYSNYNKKKSKKKKMLKDFVGFNYLIPKFNLNIDALNINGMFLSISLINAFIISFVFLILNIVDWDIAFKLLLGFLLLFGLIYSLYEFYGRYLVKKGLSNNDRR